MTRIWITAAVVLLTSEAQAGFMDGYRLYELCTSQDNRDQDLCLGYVQGAVDYLEWVRREQNRPACIPLGTPAKRVENVVVSFFRDSPPARSYEAVTQVILAVSHAWNCRIPQKP
jgi:hypothetical protein